MRPRVCALMFAPLLLAASVPRQNPSLEQPLDAKLMSARSEEAAANAETEKLEEKASRARNDAERFAANQAAAAQAIEAAEARITTADVEFRLAAVEAATNRQQLAQEERPVSSLLAGLAVTARRPPLLALLDSSDSDDLVKVSVLLQATLPIIRSRTEKLSAQLLESQKLQSNARLARSELLTSRAALAARRTAFRELEQQAFGRAISAGSQALGSSDTAIAAGEEVEQLKGAQSSQRTALETARQLQSEPPAPARPFAPNGSRPRPPLDYQLPVTAPVGEGLGDVNPSGVRSRGLLFETRRGAEVIAPADGVVRFSGPFRDYDGIIILDHGNGWMTLIVDLGSQLRAGDKVKRGEILGRAFGPIEVELSNNGRRISPALIAGSSQTLSNRMKGG